MRALWRCLLLVCVLAHGTAWAHKPSDSYLSLDVAGTTITGQWDIALRDLDFALGLDVDGDVRFPEWDRAAFDEASRREVVAANGTALAFVTYRRRAA